jgi:hypothetical protein
MDDLLNADGESARRQDMLENRAGESLQPVTQARMGLAAAFEAIGLNFTELNPIVHNALLKEALATSTDQAIARFCETLRAIDGSGVSHDGKANVLREFYGYRARQFAD